MKKLFATTLFILALGLFPLHAKAQEAAMDAATTDAPATAEVAGTQNPDENKIVLTLEQGRVVIEMRPDLAPKHVARIKELVRKGFYDGLIWHRVEDWVAQTGDPAGNGTGGSGQNIEAEFSKAPFTRGAVGMARSNDPNSADSQFFVVLTDADWLEGQYTLWGRVTEGMEFIDALEKGTPPAFPAKIVKMQVASDIPK